MVRRYRRRSNSIISVVPDVVRLASRLPWWGALLAGVLAYVVIAVLLGGYLEGQIASQAGSKFYAIIEARYGRMIRMCHWVGIACFVAGVFFAVRNYFYVPRARSGEKRVVTFLSKLIGRSLD